MNKLILTPLCILFLFGCTMQKVPESKTEIGMFTPYGWAPEYINGMIKSVDQRAYWATEQDGEYIRGDLITDKERDSIGWSDDFVVHFDSSGLATKVAYLNDEGVAYGYWKIKIEDGNYSEAMWVEDDSSSAYWIYTADDAGNLIKGERFRIGLDTLMSGANLEYDENGHFITLHWLDYKGDPTYTWTWEYNEMGLATSRESHNPEGDLVSWYKYTYDDKGLAIHMEGMSSDSTMLNVEMKYTDFDDMGNWLEMVSLEEGEVIGMDVRILEYY